MSEPPDYAALLQRALGALDDMEAQLEASERGRHQPIAVVGMSLRFPGGAHDPDSFWELLDSGRDAVTEVPPDRWDMDALFDPDPGVAGKSYTRWGGFLDGIDRFDAAFFGISPREALTMDPQQRLLLELAWEALEHAGIAPSALAGTTAGVFVGMTGTEYADQALQGGILAEVDAYFASGIARSVAAGRLAYAFDLHGPAVAVDTACSSSLVATHMACQSLRLGECDAALAAGVNLILSPAGHILTSQARMTSFEGRCKTFDASADGYVRGEGAAVLVLKRLDDAVAAGDRILGVIRGTAANQDGRSNGLTAPNAAAQEAVIRAALADGGVAPGEVSFVECHGTGTTLGDPIEVRALQAVYGVARPAGEPLLVQSVKTNVGHLEAAAGIAGLCKLLLALQHGRLPAHLHLREPNPYIPWRDVAVAPATAPQPWPAAGAEPRVGGLSAFGFSGTNVHMIVAEAPPRPAVDQPPPRPYRVHTVSARSAAALDALAGAHADRLAALGDGEWAAAAATSTTGRAHLDERIAVGAGTAGEAAELLRAAAGGTGSDGARGTATRRDEGVVMLFTGQGSQVPGMGRRLYETEPVFRAALDRSAEILRDLSGFDLLGVAFAAEPGDWSIHDTRATQPALFAHEVALASLWRSWGVEPALVLGHSIGELAAAHVAGVLSLEDALRVVDARGRLMQELPREGGMAAVLADPATVERAICAHAADLAIAALNGPRSVVISGRTDALEAAVAELTAAGVRTMRLGVSHAFHSPLMDPMLDAFEQVVAGVDRREPEIELVSNRTGAVAGPGLLTAPAYWRDHARGAVRFEESIRHALALGHRTFLEVGPAATLSGLGKGVDGAGDALFVASARGKGDEARDLHRAVAALHVAGEPVDWAGYEAPWEHRPVRLPTYPFERQRFWHPRAELGRAPVADRVAPAAAWPGRPVRSPRLTGRVFETELTPASPAWLGDHLIEGTPVVPAAAFLELMRLAVTTGGGPADLVDVRIDEPLVLTGGRAVVVQTIVDDDGTVEVHAETEHGWRRHAVGMAAPVLPPAGGTDLAAARARCATTVDAEGYYRSLADLGVVHGPRRRCIEDAARGDGEVLGTLRAPEGGSDGGGIDPATAAGGLQLLGLALPAGDGDDDAYVPVAIERWHRAGSMSGPLTAHGTIRPPAPADPAGAAAIGDVTLHDAAGRVVAAATGVRFERAPRPAFAAPPAADPGWSLVPVWVLAPLFDAPATAPGRWVVLGPPGGWADGLALALAADGSEVVRIAVAGDDATVPDRLREVSNRALTGVVVVAAEGGAAQLAAVIEAVTAPVTVLTQEAMAVVAGDRAEGYLQAGAWGVGRVAASEHPDRPCRLVDLPASATDAMAAALAELHADDGGERQVAWRGGGRYALRLAPAPASAADGPDAVVTGTWIVTGGLGGLGLAVAEELAGAGAERLVLCGRRAPSADALEVLARIGRCGTDVRTVALDVTDAAAVEAMVAAATADGAPLGGVVHAAGVVDDGLLRNLTPERFAAVLGPKVDGARNLLAAADRHHPDHVVLFAAGAGLFGPVGQAAYAAANATLDAMAHARRAAGRPAVAIDWGPWSTVGMAARLDGAVRRWEAQGVGALDPAEGRAAFRSLLAAPVPQVAVLKLRWSTLLHHYTKHGVPPIMQDLVRAARRQDLGSDSAVAVDLADELLAVAPERRRDHLAIRTREQVLAVLGLEPGHPVGPDQGLSDLGMDSLMTVELSNRLSALLNRSLPSTVALEHPTLRDLTAHLEELLAGRVEFPSAGPVEPDRYADLDEDELTDALLKELDDAGY